MKKLLKITALLLAAAAMFVGCKNNAETTTPEDDDKLILFPEEDVSTSVNYNAITCSDGEWIGAYEEIIKTSYRTTTRFIKVKFTVSDNGSTCNYTRIYEKETKEESTTGFAQSVIEANKASYEADGYTVELSDNKLKATKTAMGDETLFSLTTSMGIRAFTTKAQEVSPKTNADKTKYYGYGRSADYRDTYTFYLMKK